jgi:hypothetical protein
MQERAAPMQFVGPWRGSSHSGREARGRRLEFIPTSHGRLTPEDNMDTTSTIANYRNAPRQLPFAAHVAGACAAIALIVGGVAFAGNASEHAVHTELAVPNPTIRYVVLPTVEVVAKRQAGEMADATGCSAPAKQI